MKKSVKSPYSGYQVKFLKSFKLLYFSFLILSFFSKTHAQNIPLNVHSWFAIVKSTKLSNNLQLNTQGHIRNYYPSTNPNFIALRPVFSFSFLNKEHTILFLPFSINTMYEQELQVYSRSYLGWKINLLSNSDKLKFRQLMELQKDVNMQNVASFRFRNRILYRERWTENLDVEWSLEFLNKKPLQQGGEWANSIRFYNDYHTKITSTSLILGWVLEWNPMVHSYYFASNIQLKI